jgi:hypothetical protein
VFALDLTSLKTRTLDANFLIPDNRILIFLSFLYLPSHPHFLINKHYWNLYLTIFQVLTYPPFIFSGLTVHRELILHFIPPVRTELPGVLNR